MNYQKISEIYDANEKIRKRLKETVSDLEDAQLNFLPADGEWTIANVVEHLSIVENGMTRICAKLLTEAQGKAETVNGEANISKDFLQKISKAGKFQAPERVRPTGNLTIADSLAKMDENRQKLEELRPLFESVECSDFKFPHPNPAFGDLTAHEWLFLLGGHEARHISQIDEILSQYHLR